MRGRVASDVVSRTRSERAATAWSTSIASAGGDGGREHAAAARGTSGATTAAAMQRVLQRVGVDLDARGHRRTVSPITPR